jgi:hypothetical protein
VAHTRERNGQVRHGTEERRGGHPRGKRERERERRGREKKGGENRLRQRPRRSRKKCKAVNKSKRIKKGKERKK